MADSGAGHALRVERSCALVASALSEGRRQRVRLMSGQRFGLNAGRTIVNVPYPALAPDWTLRTSTWGIALQRSPSNDRIAHHPLYELSPRACEAAEICILAPLSSDGAITDGLRELAAASLLAVEQSNDRSLQTRKGART